MICELRTVSYPLVDPRRRNLAANFALGYRASGSSKELGNIIDLGGLIDERQKTNQIARRDGVKFSKTGKIETNTFAKSNVLTLTVYVHYTRHVHAHTEAVL